MITNLRRSVIYREKPDEERKTLNPTKRRQGRAVKMNAKLRERNCWSFRHPLALCLVAYITLNINVCVLIEWKDMIGRLSSAELLTRKLRKLDRLGTLVDGSRYIVLFFCSYTNARHCIHSFPNLWNIGGRKMSYWRSPPTTARKSATSCPDSIAPGISKDIPVMSSAFRSRSWFIWFPSPMCRCFIQRLYKNYREDPIKDVYKEEDAYGDESSRRSTVEIDQRSKTVGHQLVANYQWDE